MKKATFTSTNTPPKPTHWLRKDTKSILWKVGGAWNRISETGFADSFHGIHVTPDNHPEVFEPLYGDLVITISPEA